MSVEIVRNGATVVARSSRETVAASERGYTVEATSGVLIGGFPPYKGEYAVKPLPRDDVVLPTANRSMTRDVTVQKIPYYETSNTAGGYTAIIGE